MERSELALRFISEFNTKGNPDNDFDYTISVTIDQNPDRLAIWSEHFHRYYSQGMCIREADKKAKIVLRLLMGKGYLACRR